MKKQISTETLFLLEDYGIELTPEIEKILTDEPVKPVIPNFQKIAKDIASDLKTSQKEKTKETA